MNLTHVLIGFSLSVCTSLAAQAQLVQSAGTSASAAHEVVVRLQQAPLPGSLLVVCHGTTSLRGSFVQGGGVSSWTLCRASLPTAGNCQVWAGIVDTAPDTVISLKQSDRGDSNVIVSEWQGCGPVLSFASAAASGTHATAAVPAPPGTLSTAPGDLVVAMVGVGRGAAKGIGAPGNGFVELTRESTSRTCAAVAYDVRTAGGPVATQWQIDPPFRWAALMVVFHVPTTPPPELVQQVAAAGHDLADLDLTLPQLPAPGNLLVICHDSTSGGGSTVQGGGVSNWTLCQTSLPTRDNSEIWAGIVDGVPSASIRVVLGGSPNTASAIVGEWDGFAAPPTISGMFSTATDIVATAGPVTADAGDLVVAMLGDHGGGQSVTPATDGFLDLLAPPAQPSNIMAAAWTVPSAGGSYGTSWTLGYRHVWATAIVVFHRP